MNILEQAEEIVRMKGRGLKLEDELGILLCNVMLSDSEVRLLSYIAMNGDIDMGMADLASLFGWSVRKVYYVMAALEGKGMWWRKAARGVRAK